MVPSPIFALTSSSMTAPAALNTTITSSIRAFSTLTSPSTANIHTLRPHCRVRGGEGTPKEASRLDGQPLPRAQALAQPTRSAGRRGGGGGKRARWRGEARRSEGGGGESEGVPRNQGPFRGRQKTP
ncbi:hypothetical protein I4F81_009374 [Pyropia yezoensis]|uniref:Uncharacterized protein n=1 Tax=Pyropia yezoensis TaxID=2788 RepID=A0ACC3CAN2_PYRYE|nr:hypothetical protein I4F81_009374 [Neopyropia yezoensis]